MKNIFYVFIVSITVLSCGLNDVEEADSSLTGDWQVVSIYTETGEKVENGIQVSSDTLEVNVTGSFSFSDQGKADYSFVRLGEMNTDTDLNWSIAKTTVNCGFTNCDLFILTLGMDSYVCEFGDSTDDAHINATEVKLISETIDIGDYLRVEISLVK